MERAPPAPGRLPFVLPTPSRLHHGLSGRIFVFTVMSETTRKTSPVFRQMLKEDAIGCANFHLPASGMMRSVEWSRLSKMVEKLQYLNFRKNPKEPTLPAPPCYRVIFNNISFWMACRSSESCDHFLVATKLVTPRAHASPLWFRNDMGYTTNRGLGNSQAHDQNMFAVSSKPAPISHGRTCIIETV